MSRDALVISALTLVSRVSGLVRVLVVGAVLGRGVLADVYQTANTVPNVLFELLAGGALQGALVPMFVAAERADPEHGLERTAAAVARSLLRLLGFVCAAGVVLAPAAMWLLTLAEPDPSVAADKWRLGTWMLWIFLPQLLWYALGVIATSALAARRRFAAAAVAPLVNNLVVIAAYVLFDVLRGDRAPSLDLRIVELVVLAGGTTAAVVAFTSIPVIAAHRAGIRWWGVPVDPAIGSGLRRTGGWAMLHVAVTLSLQVGVLLAGNGAPGGVALFTWGLTFFLLPAALIAVPVATALTPRLAELHLGGQRREFGRAVWGAARTVLAASAAAAVGLAVLAWPIVRLLPLGELGRGDLAPVAHTLQAFAPGIVGYGAWALGARVLFAMEQVRTAAVTTTGAAVAGLVGMGVASAVAPDTERAAALAGVYGAAFTLAAAVMWVGLRHTRVAGVEGKPAG